MHENQQTTITQVVMQKISIKPKVHRPKSGTQGWFVYYSVREPDTGYMKRKKVKQGFAQCKTITECEKNAKRLVREYTRKLENGYNPYLQHKKYNYLDELQYEKDISPKEKKGIKNIVYYCNRFQTEQKRKKLAPKSLSSYKAKLRMFELWAKQSKKHRIIIDQFTIEDAKMFFKHLVEIKELKGKTLNGYRSVLMGVWSYATELRIIEQRQPVVNIWKQLSKYKEDVTPAMPVSIENVKKFKDYCKLNEEQMWIASMLLMNCFIRPIELNQLKIKMIDLDNRKIKLPGTITKGLSRSPDFSKEVKIELEEYLAKHNYKEDYFLFTTSGVPGVKRTGRDQLSKRFRKIADYLGLPRSNTFYCLKHTGAVMAVKAGANVKDIQAQMGHTDLATTDEYLKNMIGYNNNYFKTNVAYL